MAPQRRHRNRDNVVEAHDTVLVESIAQTHRNFGGEPAHGAGNRRDGDSGQVRSDEFSSQHEDRPSLVELGDVDGPQSISIA